ncbi:type II toxin-antitoxin system Phd/YefM family antitoxin [Quadrisphaera sp. DSM 44207]|uniref:type II toxin-antitoxin system Phd/YefM family antitoxin n=1 Tax=Quadrisphaera sp. DSM 44207 TaxID=1881057 RepID=UPI0008847BF1|nr:type II toxin-antitoxin system prevent-host-death family antitoxin [Quadrisphaera sp. DSM 44207]SDQ35183.1 prevent-host-death family protein [Quadrisphaera sp. DSM 44207]
MTEIAARELRNDTSAVIRRAQGGEHIVITVRGRPAAQLVPLPHSGPGAWVSREQLVRQLRTVQADAGLRRDLAELAGDTTDDLEPLT